MAVSEGTRSGTSRRRRLAVVLFENGSTHLVRPDGRRVARAVALCGKRGRVDDVLPYRIDVCGECRLVEDVLL